MKMTERIKDKRGLVIGGVILAVLLILWMANRWVEYKITAALESGEKNLHFEQVKAGVLSGKIIVRGIEWKGDSSYVRIRGLRVNNFSFMRFLTDRRIVIESIEIDQPLMHLARENRDSMGSTSSDLWHRLRTVEIGKIMADSGRISFSQKDPALAPVLISFPFLEAEDLYSDRSKIDENIPFVVGKLSLVTDSVFYQVDALYELSAKQVRMNEGDIRIDTFRIRPRYGKQAFQNHIPFQKTRADLMVPRMMLTGFAWEASDDTLFFSGSSLELDSADLQLYRDKTLDENPIVKPLYSKMMRELPFGLKVDSVQVNAGRITYEILFQKERDPGMVYLEQVEGRIKNLTNRGMGEGNFPRTHVHAGALFMKESKIDLDWSFRADDPADGFHVSGSLSRITDRSMNFFLEPAFHVSAEGAIDALQFNFWGDDVRAEGAMRMRYEKLKIEWLKDDGRPRKMLSMMSNLLLRKKMSGSAEKEGIEVERVQTKSFWAYLWKMVQTGSLEFLL